MKRISLFLGVSLALAASSAFAATLVPGAADTAPDMFGAINGTVEATYSFSGNTNSLYASYTEWVVSDSANVYCAGCLDFIIMVTDSSNSGDDIEEVSTGNFAPYMVDAGVATSLNGASGGGHDPNGVALTPNGQTPNFNFNGVALTPGQTTDYLVVETNSTTYSPGTVTVQNSNTLQSAGFAPAPEPLSLGLIGAGLALLGGIARSRRAAKRG